MLCDWTGQAGGTRSHQHCARDGIHKRGGYRLRTGVEFLTPDQSICGSLGVRFSANIQLRPKAPMDRRRKATRDYRGS